MHIIRVCYRNSFVCRTLHVRCIIMFNRHTVYTFTSLTVDFIVVCYRICSCISRDILFLNMIPHRQLVLYTGNTFREEIMPNES